MSPWLMAMVTALPAGFVLGYYGTKWALHKNAMFTGEAEEFECTHNDSLCSKFGCPDDPNWKGDGCK